MPALHEVQAAFAAAMLAGRSSPALSRCILAAGIPAERRLAVYRANVVLSLRRLLERTFPAVRRLLGEERFARLADAFVRQAPPSRPQLLAYGSGFADFLVPVGGLIADVARLEWAREEAYHAAQALHLAWGTIRRPEDNLTDAQFRARGNLVEIEHEGLGKLPYTTAPWLADKVPWQVYRRAPRLGEHNADIYRGELGLEDHRLQQLHATRVI